MQHKHPHLWKHTHTHTHTQTLLFVTPRPSLKVYDEAWLRQSNWTCPDGSNLSPGYLRKWENCSFQDGHRCGVCHNASNAQVRTKEYNIRGKRILIWQSLILFECLCFCTFCWQCGGLYICCLGFWPLWLAFMMLIPSLGNASCLVMELLLCSQRSVQMVL